MSQGPAGETPLCWFPWVIKGHTGPGGTRPLLGAPRKGGEGCPGPGRALALGGPVANRLASRPSWSPGSGESSAWSRAPGLRPWMLPPWRQSPSFPNSFGLRGVCAAGRVVSPRGVRAPPQATLTTSTTVPGLGWGPGLRPDGCRAPSLTPSRLPGGGTKEVPVPLLDAPPQTPLFLHQGWVARPGGGTGIAQDPMRTVRRLGARPSGDCWWGQGWQDMSWHLLCFVCFWNVYPPVELLGTNMFWEPRQLWTLL